jgi:hypothetical protein
MEIRGDPYWLGVPGLLLRERYKNLGSKINADEFADYYLGATRLYLEVKSLTLPESDDDTEIQKVSDRPSVLSAVYGVSKVKHKFKVGKFTQEIEGFRDLAVHGKKMIDLLAEKQKTESESRPAQPPVITGEANQDINGNTINSLGAGA